MKKSFFLFPLLSVFWSFAAISQNTPIPRDSMVRVGHLENGLTYYIRHNEMPKERAEFYIAQRVGSVLEEENQRGLAHFLEHMCFNGTKNFPGNSLITELEAKGVKFGDNINAYTSIDETVYNLSNIPVTRDGLIDTALLVLHDWSGFVLLTDKDIDDERGVIREEWRTGNTGNYRVLEATIKNVLKGSRYAERIPIGLIDVINNFPHQAIRDYYKKWYRPDLQAVIVVGDIDVNQVEAKIKKLFADVPKPVNPAPRPEFEVQNNVEPIVSIVSDPEVQSISADVFYKMNAVDKAFKETTEYYSTILLDMLIPTMFNQRLYEVSQKSNPPYAGASVQLGDFSVAKTKRAWAVSVSPRNNDDFEVALRAILTENERMRRYGFTIPEFERAKLNILRGYESVYNERDKRDNGAYVDEYVQHFINGVPFPGVEWEYEYIQNFFANLTLDRVNELAKTFIADTNVVFAVTGPKRDGVTLPTQSEILSVWNDVRFASVDPYVEESVDRPLLEKMPVAGKVVKVKQEPFGYIQWILSNGAKVFVKKTNYKKDEVVMSSYSDGGISLVDEKDLPSAMAIGSVLTLGGVGTFSQVELGKVLTGKMVNVFPYVGDLSEGISGGASPRDFETMLQLTYLYFTQPRMDQDAFDTWKTDMQVQLENSKVDPMNSLSDTLNKLQTNNNPRGKRFDLEMLSRVDYEKALSIYRERFANAGDFTFFITGNVEPDSIRGLVELYIGGLPAVKGHEKFIDRDIYPVKGVVKNHFSRKLETPKSTVIAIYSGKLPYTLRNIVLMNYLRGILDIVYTENIREKEGGTYGVRVNGGTAKYPKERFAFYVQFDTDPIKKDKLLNIVHEEINGIMMQNPSAENVQKVKEYMLKSFQEYLNDNSYWDSAISMLEKDGVDMHSNYEETVRSITPSMIRDFAKKIFSQGNLIEVSMNPEEK